MTKLCECGCGKLTNKRTYSNPSRGYVKGEYARFIHGHNAEKVERVEVPCSSCGNTLTLYPKGVKKRNFCNYRCAGDFLTKPEGSKYTDYYGYVKIKVGKRWVAEHRYVIEKYLGRKLLKTEDVHHKNEDRTDNRLDNLEVMDHSEHLRMHMLERHSNKNVREFLK